jgi:class 3 adenylate cyclase
VAGAGINLAQRVMDCGDAGHILLSHHVAEDLAEYERWRPFLDPKCQADVASFPRPRGKSATSPVVARPRGSCQFGRIGFLFIILTLFRWVGQTLSDLHKKLLQ